MGILNNDFADDFTRANSADVDGGWLNLNNDVSSISGNSLLMTSGGGNFETNIIFAPHAADFQDGEGFVEFTFTGSAVPILYVRYNPVTNEGYLIYWVSGDLRLAKYVGTTLTTLTNVAQSLSVGTRYSFRFTMAGNTKTAILRNEDTSSDLQTLVNTADTVFTALGSVGLSLHTAGTVSYYNFTSTKDDDVIAEDIADDGLHGAGYVFPSLSFPDNDGRVITMVITTAPNVISGAGTLTSSELQKDSSFNLVVTGNCVVQWVFNLFVDGVLNNTGLTATVTIGAAASSVAVLRRQIMKKVS